MNKKKIILGTAQFIKNYSLFKKNISNNKKRKILQYFNRSGCRFFEVSPNYGDSENFLGKKLKNKKIIWKLPKLPEDNHNIEGWIYNTLKRSLLKLKEKKIHILMIHNSEDLLKSKGLKLFQIIKDLQKKGYFYKLGVSVYKKQILNQIIKKFKIDVVQLPFNILNYEFTENDLILLKKKNKKLEIHARSVFHQGLLLKKINKPKKKFKNLINEQNKIITKLEDHCLKNEYNLFQLCFSFVIKNKLIDKVLIGVESVQELKKILNFKKKPINLYPKIRYNKKILNPISWLKLKY